MIEYLDDIHQYLIDGVLVPSVTQIVSWWFEDSFASVDSEVLKRSADYGTMVHKSIENYEAVGIGEGFPEIETWKTIKERYGISIDSSEQIVAYKNLYCGRYDHLGKIGDRQALFDIKTTSKYMRDHLELQMGLYKLALGIDCDCYCVWMPRDGRAELYKVNPTSEEKCLEIVEQYTASDGNKAPVRDEIVPFEQFFTVSDIARIKAFYDLKKEIEALEERGKQKALSLMKEKGIKSIQTDLFKMTYTEATVRKSADAEKMKADGIFEKYAKETPVKESVRITWRK